MKMFHLFCNEFKLQFWAIKRYIFNTVSMLVVFLLIFIGMFWGVKTLGGASVTSDSLDTMLVGYILWVSALLALSSTGSEVLNESQQGTLEQIYLSPLGAHNVFFFRSLVGMFFNFMVTTVMLYLSMALTGRWLHVNLAYLYVMIFLSTLSLIGISFMIGGLSLIHKKVGSVNQILSFGLIGLMMLPTYPLTLYDLLPFIAGAATVRNSVVRGTSYPVWWYLLIAANGLLYLAIGFFVFKKMETKARRLNKMGQY